jgi:hypothetical protein
MGFSMAWRGEGFLHLFMLSGIADSENAVGGVTSVTKFIPMGGRRKTRLGVTNVTPATVR